MNYILRLYNKKNPSKQQNKIKKIKQDREISGYK